MKGGFLMTEIQRARAEAAHLLDLAFSISDVAMKTALQTLADTATKRAAELEAHALSVPALQN
jgi:hypothetical protein